MEIVSDVSIISYGKRKRKFADFKCDCGNIFRANLDNVKYGNTTSCGCRSKKLKKLPSHIKGIKVVKDLGMSSEFKKPKRKALFECECGNIFEAKINAIKSGQKKSCGCLKHKPSTYTHLKTKHPLYRKWSGMITRCTNKKERTWRRYGGRGIKVCDEWRNDFMSFYEWAIKSGYKDGLTLDRIDNNGNYEPNNCQWITMEENSIKDRRSTYLYKNKQKEICEMYLSEHITITKLSEIYKTSSDVISKILKNNNIKIENRRMRNVTNN